MWLRDEDYQSKNRGQGMDGLQAVSTSCNGTSPASPVKRLKRYCPFEQLFLSLQFAILQSDDLPWHQLQPPHSSLGSWRSGSLSYSRLHCESHTPAFIANPISLKTRKTCEEIGTVTMCRNHWPLKYRGTKWYRFWRRRRSWWRKMASTNLFCGRRL